jgi:UDP-glucose 4-epimerase
MAQDKDILKNRRWLITGGCGFIGTNLVAHLLKQNQHTKIRILDNLSVGTKGNLSDVCEFTERDDSKIEKEPQSSQKAELVVGDIRDYVTCLKCCKGVDVIVHLAASTGVPISVENPRSDMESNVIGTFNMLEAARQKGVQRFIFASSGAPVGEVEPPIHEELAPKPVSPYGASKLGGEAYCSAFNCTYGLKTISLRFGNAYGPRSSNKNSVIAKFIKRALKGKQLEIYGDGNQTRDFIYIDDLIQAIILSAKSEMSGEIFQIATHNETTVNDIAYTIKQLVETTVGQNVGIIHKNARLGDVARNYFKITKAKKHLMYSPQYDLKRGIKKTLSYFLDRNQLV